MEEKINYENLTQIVYDLIYSDYEKKDSYLSIEDIIDAEKITDIILDNTPDVETYEFKNRVSKENSIKYVHELLKKINKEYAKEFMNILSTDIFIKGDNQDIYEGQPYTFNDGDKNRIYLPEYDTILNAYCMIHEFMHYLNMKKEYANSPAYDLFTEMFSFVSELLLTDYFKEINMNVKDYKKENINSFTSVRDMALRMKLEIFFIKEILEKGYIDKMSILDLVSNLDINNLTTSIVDIKYDIEDILENGMKFFYIQNYLLGAVIGSYVHQKILDNPKYIKQFVDLNKRFYKMSVEQVFQYLDINYGDNISMEDYKKIEKCYKKEMNRLW